MEKIRIIELPKCKMVSSGLDTSFDFSEGSKLNEFDKWWSALDKNRKDKFYPRDFLWFDEENGGLVWYYAVDEEIEDTNGFEVVDFKGGLYAVATSIDGNEEDNTNTYIELLNYINNSDKFIIDKSRPSMGHVITPRLVIDLGLSQMDTYVPIKIK